MKKIHILPTDKPSRYVTNYMEQTMQWQNLFITSDEEIKEGDKELEVYKRDHPDALLFVEEVDVY